jgi:hypothetical protein
MKRPLLIYDNHCKPCSRFASIVQRLSRGWIIVIGHYSYQGEQFRDLPNARDMFWIIIDKQAYGGRYGLLPLFKEIVRGILSNKHDYDRIGYEECYDNCSLLRRIASLFVNGKRIKLG